MTDAICGFLHRRHTAFGERTWTADHDYREAEHACRGDLAVGRLATAVLGDDNVHAMIFQKRPLRRLVERAALQDKLSIRRRFLGIGGIDAAHDVEMLGTSSKRQKLLAADGEEDPARRFAENLSSMTNAFRLDPSVTFDRLPRRTLQCDERGPRFLRGKCSILGDARRERMRGIDQNAHAVFADIARQSLRASKTADADFPGLRARCCRASRKRQGDAQRGLAHEHLRELSRFAGSAKDQNMPGVH